MKKPDTSVKIALAIAGAMFLISPAISLRVDPGNYDGGRSRDVGDRAERNSSAFATMMGEVRTSMADMLFIKTERYLHSGVAYMPHMEEELLSLSGEFDELTHHRLEMLGLDDDDDDDHSGIPTIIPTADNDFRGFIGHLHRAVKPFRDPDLPHIHTDGTELLPWYRLMTMADPRNVRAYSVGGWWLKHHNVDEGIRFVREGIRNNPNAFSVHYSLGLLLDHRTNAHLADGADPADPQIQQWIQEALTAYQTAARLGMNDRPADYDPDQPHPRWTEYQDADLMAAIRIAVMQERNHGNPDKALEQAREFNQNLGGDGVLERLISRWESGEEDDS